MNILNTFNEIRQEHGLCIDNTTAAILVLADVIAHKRLSLDDGESIAHGICLGLRQINDKDGGFSVNVSGVEA
jgi:riboflavin synthase alpha subunit